MVRPKHVRRHAWLALACAFVVAATSGCAAVYPEIGTRLGQPPANATLEPPPPDDRFDVSIVGATVPPTMRDGRPWGETPGALPDPYLVVRVNDAELLRTDPESGTLRPRWPTAPRGTFKLAVGDAIELQLWAANALSDYPIGLKKLRLSRDAVSTGTLRVELTGGGGGEVEIALGPPKAAWGVGLWFELRNDGATVSRVLDASPASRSGVVARDRIVAIDDKPIETLSPNDVRSLFGAIPSAGRKITVEHAAGGVETVVLVEGPIYPLLSEERLIPKKTGAASR
jgi:hypothetical protein